MSDVAAAKSSDLVRLSSMIVSAYVCRNAVTLAALPDLITTVHAALRTLDPTVGAGVVAPEVSKPSAAEIKRSITWDGLRSFLDGRTYQVLKRHLDRQGLTIAEYRERFGLPSTYPMVAPAFTAKRSALAKANGLGRSRQLPDGIDTVTPIQAESAVEATPPAAPKRRGRPKGSGKAG